jgi:hypothetical protein
MTRTILLRALLAMLIVASAPAAQAQVQIATLITPANGASNIDPTNPVQFTWTSVSDEQCYYLYVGTTLGGKDVVNSGETQLTSWSAYVGPLTKYYVRMWTKVNGGWYYNDTTFSTGTGIARLITPANGAINVDPTYPVQFTWTSVPTEQAYYLYVGTTLGGKDLVNSGETQQTNWTASVSPLTLCYVRLWTKVNGGWFYNDTTFTTSAGIARLTAPPNGATNVDPTLPVQFTWTSVPTELAYYLYVGTTKGAKDVVNSGETQKTSWTANVVPSTTLYARIWTKFNSGWKYSDSTFTTGTGLARLKSPANGATNVSQFQQFTWNTVSDSLITLLLVSPTSYETWDNYAEDLAPTVSSRYVWGLLPNTYYYASLCTQKVSGWTCANSNFTTGPAGPLPDRQTFYNTVQSLTSQVRLMTYGMTNKAIPGTALYQDMLDHMKDPNNVDCGYYTFTLLDLMTQGQILGRRRDMSLDATADGHVIAEYWDPFNNKWQIADSTFGLVYFDAQSEIGQGAEDVNALLLAGNFSAITPLFVTSNGSAYMTNYYLDPITMFNNVFPFGDTKDNIHDYMPNSPLPFLNATTLGVAQGNYGIYVFQFANQTDQITINNAGTPVIITPQNIYGWAAGTILWNGWYVTSSVPDGMNIYTYKRIMF